MPKDIERKGQFGSRAKPLVTWNRKPTARVRRNKRSEQIDHYHRPPEAADLKIGDRIEVERQVNNPYLVFLRKVN